MCECVSETVPLVERARLSAVHSVQCRQVATDKTTKFLYKTIKHLVLLYIICYNIFIDYKYESGNNCYIINTVVHFYFTDFNTCVCVCVFFFYLNVMWFALFCAESSNIGLRSAPACSFFPTGRCECVRLCVYACVHEHWTVWIVFFVCFILRVTGLLNLTVLKIKLTKTFYICHYMLLNVMATPVD